jgi:hypothetical protein
MLKETPNIADKNTRWFSDDYFDLIVWYNEQGKITGFQLCYDKKWDERAFTWKENQTPIHERIDSGETSPLKNMAPILVPDGIVPYEELIRRFREHAAEIDAVIFELVVHKLAEDRH